jgi:hypothetical protein
MPGDPSAVDPLALDPLSPAPAVRDRHWFVPARGTGTLAARLERDRLEVRAAQLDRVVGALRARARAFDDTAVPAPLSTSLTDLQRELTAVRARLGASRGPSAGYVPSSG